MTTTPEDVTAYVRHAAWFLDLRLDDAQAERVAQHLARTQAMVAMLRDVPLGPGEELAEVFRAAPFPEEDAA